MKHIRTFGPIELSIDYHQSVNYAMLLNGGKIITGLAIRNVGTQLLADVQLSLSGYFFPTESVSLGNVAVQDLQDVTGLTALPELSRLLTLTEAIYTEFQISITAGTSEVASFRFPVTLQAWNQWSANPAAYQEIASFVMPNHPAVIEIIQQASGYLQSHSHYSSFCGYEVGNYSDVVEQVRAIWHVLKNLHLKYLTANPNFVDSGQRVMTPDLIVRYRHSNCLDLSLLLCSCLERIGLSPCLVFVPGHVVAGVWINPNRFISNPVTTAVTEIREDVFSENPSLMLIESTALCSRTTLADATQAALSKLGDTQIIFAVDITNAREAEVRSLPVNITESPLPEEKDIIGTSPATEESSRKQGWERKLLDLSLRNIMLNLKPRKTVVPIREHDTAAVVDHLKAGTLTDVVGYPEKNNTDDLKNLFRAARTSLEENGANSLFVSIGALRWFDVDDSRAHIAPLLFIPVSIVRKKAMTYEVRLSDEEPMVNVTLIEMLRQLFGATFPELDTLKADDEGIPDWKQVFDLFYSHIVEINKQMPCHRRWELLDQSYIGIFSFKKFLLWHDIHFNPEIIDAHHVLRGLIENRYQPICTPCPAEARSIESGNPTDLMLPIDYDSSQLEAVAESHSGHSFVLHGPPGTGKSQTITNIIADALYAGRRVLFVAEKKAALDVVRSRLKAIGLKPYCLELHSNKADKRSFFTQVQLSGFYELARDHFSFFALPRNPEDKPSPDTSDEYSDIAATLSGAQRYLREITDALHTERSNGLSLFDCINRYLEKGYSDLVLSFSEIKHLTPKQIKELCDSYRSLDVVAEIMGYHPGSSDLVGLYPRENTADNQNAVTETLRQLPEAIGKSRKKAASLLNRWFVRRTPEDILSQNPLWTRLHEVAMVTDDKCGDIDTFEQHIARWQGAINELRRWYHFSEKAVEIAKYNLPGALAYYLQGKEGSLTADALHSGYFRNVAYHAIDNDSRLRGFSRRIHEEKISHYHSHARQFQDTQRAQLIKKMRKNLSPDFLTPEQKSQLSLLVRRYQSSGRGIALRKIIAESPDVLGMLFPCMLMSPLSVAQYLEMVPDLFDIVIFDEASQMETPDAVGAIARGRNLIVVGDPLQLPPTTFFTKQSPAGEEIEESEDSDSILEDCIALGMPSKYLSRHYRSRHESLIAFSNNRFYDNKLLTFASHNDCARKVSLIDPHGIYDYGKTRTNPIEAEAVVDHIINLLKSPGSSPSVGVVAFSKAQSNLIEDILTAKTQRDKLLQLRLNEAQEPLFIKNLENVQGDERDIIIFSIGYGPDKNGNVSLNFGPLNQRGGERRLNVAVSRAREEMVVFSSLHPRHFPTDSILPQGVSALRDFLSYAIDNKLDRSIAGDDRSDVIVEDIAARLRKHGLKVVTHVGRSAFKVDVAVVDEKDPDSYRLGIIVDGHDYNSLPTVRDREITVPAVLRSLGWNIRRIWTIDWLENPDAVIHRLLAE